MEGLAIDLCVDGGRRAVSGESHRLADGAAGPLTVGPVRAATMQRARPDARSRPSRRVSVAPSLPPCKPRPALTGAGPGSRSRPSQWGPVAVDGPPPVCMRRSQRRSNTLRTGHPGPSSVVRCIGGWKRRRKRLSSVAVAAGCKEGAGSAGRNDGLSALGEVTRPGAPSAPGGSSPGTTSRRCPTRCPALLEPSEAARSCRSSSSCPFESGDPLRGRPRSRRPTPRSAAKQAGWTSLRPLVRRSSTNGIQVALSGSPDNPTAGESPSTVRWQTTQSSRAMLPFCPTRRTETLPTVR